MRLFVPLASLWFLAACATVTADSHQEITIATDPPGAHCLLRNNAGQWLIEQTPDTAFVKRSFSPLTIECASAAGSAQRTVAASTRGRAYGNILLLGVPAFVDAATGDGYAYDPHDVTLSLIPPGESRK